jgi:predicted nucleic acid-binding Zn ribbon protein|tara:strand:- start:979 stop:1155 length:177 start_codon:yes stop_codon:yes gene_type:complete
MARMNVNQVATDLAKHEAVCAERWLEILNRVKRVEIFIVATLVTLLLGMGSILTGQLF